MTVRGKHLAGGRGTARVGVLLCTLLLAGICVGGIAERGALAAPAKLVKKPRTVAPTPNWETQLVEHIKHNKQYPPPSVCRGEQGTTKLRFSTDRRGRLLASKIDTSSGFPTLDEEALALLARSQPFPAPPRQRTGAKFEFVVPINFRLPETSDRAPLVLKVTLKGDLTIALGNEPVDREELGGVVFGAANGNKMQRVCLFAEQTAPEADVTAVTKLLQTAGFSNVVVVRFDKGAVP